MAMVEIDTKIEPETVEESENGSDEHDSVNNGVISPGKKQNSSQASSSAATPKKNGAPPRKFNVGDLVWAKLKSFPFWPGKVTDGQIDGLKKPKGGTDWVPILFFGSNNHAYCDAGAGFVRDYFEWKNELENSAKTGGFVAAVKEIDDYILAFPNLKRKASDALKRAADVQLQIEEDLRKVETSEVNDDNQSTASSKRSFSGAEPRSKKISRSTKRQSVVTHVGSRSAPRVLNGVASSSSSSSPSTGGGGSHLASSAATASLLTSSSPFHVRKPLMLGKASSKKVGFVGLGTMGMGMAKNLADSGHTLVLYDRSPEKCAQLMREHAATIARASSARELVRDCDIVFSCVSDRDAVLDVVFGNEGIASAAEEGSLRDKAYVEMCTIDIQTSLEVYDVVTQKGGKYLEAPMCGNKQSAIDGHLIFLCSGDRQVFEDCEPMFHAMGRRAVYLGDVGNAMKAKLIHQQVQGTVVVAVAEALALADKLGLSQQDIADMFEMTDLKCPLIKNASKEIIDSVFTPPTFKLHLMQTGLQAVTQMGHIVEQSLPVTAAANELYKAARRVVVSDMDCTAVYRSLAD